MRFVRLQGARWWPVMMIGLFALTGLIWVRVTGDRTAQGIVVWTLLIGVLTVLSLLVWLLFGSRLPWRERFKSLLILVLIGVAFGFIFEIRGVSGNLVPSLGWRWTDSKVGVTDDETTGFSVGTQSSGEVLKLSYPKFLGPNGDASVSGPVLETDWSAQPPTEIWRRSVGAGWSAFSVAEGMAVTQEQHGDEEQVVAYDLMSGEVVWRHSDLERYATTLGGVGPRATPTIDSGVVYTVGATGLLNALELGSGQLTWQRDILDDADARNTEWGKSCSPLVWNGMVIVSAGGTPDRSLIAYEKETGEIIWMGGNDLSGYSSPKFAKIADRDQILILNWSTVAGHAPTTGEVLWEYPWPSDQPNVAQPVPIGADSVLVSSGYGDGSKLLRLVADGSTGMRAELVWESLRFKAKFSNYVLFEDKIYGLDDGVLACLNPDTGERCWKKGRYGHGQLLLVDKLLLVLTEKGVLVLIRPNPEALEELARFQVLGGKTWNNLALAGPYLLVRNASEAVMVELPTVNG